jgi:hypothetical protein
MKKSPPKECIHEWRAKEIDGEMLAFCKFCGGWAKFQTKDIIDALNEMLNNHTYIAKRKK